MADNEQILQTEETVEPSPENSVAPSPKKSKFITKDVVKCVVVLAVIALVAGILLGVMNWLTYVDPDEVIMKKVATFYSVSLENVTKDEARAVSDGGKSYVSACYVAKGGAQANADGISGYCYLSVGAGAKGGTLSLLVYIDTDGIIKNIAVYEQSETAGYFKRVEEANKSRYVGVDVDAIDNFALRTDVKEHDGLPTGDVAAKAGATYSSKGYHNAVCAAVYAYKNCEEV